jgi:DNA-binding transcriptional ArsR family regulator
MAKAKAKQLSAGQLVAVSRLFAALAEPSRLALLQLLRNGPLTVNELVAASGMKQANVSKHLAVLHSHHLVRRERAGILVRYEMADTVIFSLCDLVCAKVQRDLKHATAIFRPGR